MESISIENRLIGKRYKPFIIAEISGNHNGDIKNAFQLIEKAYESGADAIKLQTYTADTITIKNDSEDFKITDGLWKGRTLYELYNEAHTPWEWHKPLFEKARELGILIFSSPFDFSAVDFLETLHVPAYKVASFELLDLSLIEYIASKKKPMIISTGMAQKEDIEKAIKTSKKAGASEILLLHCVSGYPTPVSEINLEMINQLAIDFNLPIGLSDHTLGTLIPSLSIALGSCVIEKHFTLSRNDGGPDAAFSIEPNELKVLVENCYDAWEAKGKRNYKRSPSEIKNMKFRRSLYVVKDLLKGEIFTNHNIRSIRPGYGMNPSCLGDILNKRAAHDLKEGTALKKEHVID